MSKKTLAPSRVVTHRDPKGSKFISIVEAAYNKAGLSEEEAQRVNDAGGLSDLIKNFIAENRLTGRFKDEEVQSIYRYPPEYEGPKPIDEQIKAIAAIFDLDPAAALEYAEHLPPLPTGAEGYFAIPSVKALARKHFPAVTDPAEQYCRAVQLVLEKIAAARKFYNYREGRLGPDRLRQHERTVWMLAQLAESQPGDILIVAAQLGMRHRGRSIRRAREVFAPHEFGLGTVAVGSIVITHPERIVRYQELDMDGAGDEYSPDAGGVFDRAPLFDFSSCLGKVGFDARGVGRPSGYYGAASGFLPQVENCSLNS